MSNNYFTPYMDDVSEFSATNMNRPLSSFDEALSYVKNSFITIDGGIQTDNVTGAFSFTGKMRFLFTNPNSGALVENTAGSTKYILGLGDCLYVDLNNSNGTEIALIKKGLTAGSSFILPANRVLVAYRNAVSGEIYLANMLQKTAGSGQSTERMVALADGVNAAEGLILCLLANGKYGLADNAQIGTTLDLVMVKAVGDGEATVIETGIVAATSDVVAGSPLYLGSQGTFTQELPTGSGKIVKCVGYATGKNIIKFKPDSLGIELV